MDTGMIVLKQPGITDEQIAKAMNSQSNPDRVSIQRGRYEFIKFHDVTLSELQANKTKVMTAQNKVIVAREVFPTQGMKTLDEARGYVVAEYQDFLEKQWNEKMPRQYPLKVNEQTFKMLNGTNNATYRKGLKVDGSEAGKVGSSRTEAQRKK